VLWGIGANINKRDERRKEINKKTASFVLITIVLMELFLITNRNVNAGWSEMNGTEAGQGYYDIWGFTDNDVFISGCFGTKLYYDGNPQENWYEWPKLQGH